MKRWYLVLAAALLLCGCGQSTQPGQAKPQTRSPGFQSVSQEVLEVALEAKNLAEAPIPAMGFVPEAVPSGEREERCDDAVVDYSHTEDGYIMVRFTTPTDQRLKVRVYGPQTVYTYNLPADEWTVFPLSDGNGGYQVVIYQNTTGNKYATVMSVKFDVTLLDEFAPFLRPNQYVDYSTAVATVAKGAQLCAGLEHPLDKVAAVYDYVVSNFTYDYDKAANVKSGYLPALDPVLEAKTGICFDYAALMTAMLRSQGIPCKLVVGYAGDVYHAWISVWTEENGWVDGAIFFDGQTWKRMDPTFASSGQRSDEIMNFIENGTYTVKYLY